MPEIGATLRDARMRARIDISEIEAKTKIRAKYLRALENEEWDLLPGPTYVKSFLRTYADALHLDGKRLVEEYKLQYERLSDVELQPIAPPGRRDLRQPSHAGRWWLAGLAVVVLIAGLYFLGRGGDDEEPTAATAPTVTQEQEPAGSDREERRQARRERRERRQAAAGGRMRLQVIPEGPVYVCLVGDDGEVLIDRQVLQPGGDTPTFRAREFAITLGNGAVTLRIDGRDFDVPESAEPLGYAITPDGREALPEEQRPTCEA
jgi:cytoskeleton protein RodZ